jgi:predicted thioredoxin/glutaredoxin
MDTKNKNGDAILLIPIAANLELASIELATINNNVTQIPSILIDSRKVVDKVVTFDELEKIIFEKK